MCCTYRPISHTCCNPLKRPNHSTDIDVLPVTDFEREHFSAYIGSATVLCAFCRLHLSQTLHEDLMDDYLLLVDVLSRITGIQEQQRRNERRTRAVRELQSQFRELMDNSPEDNISTTEKSVPTGIEMLLAAAEYVEKNTPNHELENGQSPPVGTSQAPLHG